jgi:cyanophycin synthetase
MLNVPIIAITGTNGKTTTARLIERIYLDAGYNVGTCTTEGVTHNGELIWRGDASWGYGALDAAKCPNVDLLVLETGRGGIVRFGLGFRKCHVGIVTNLYEDHLGFDGINTIEEMAQVKSLIPKRTDPQGVVILNGDDNLVRQMAKKTRAAPIFFVVENDPNQFKRVFYLKKNSIYKRMDSNDEFVINVKDIPITYKGMLAHNIPNVMAALASLEGINKFLPTNKDSLEKTLTEFGNRPSDNFNRFGIVTFKGEKVILGFTKNPESCRREIEVIKRIRDFGRFVNVVGVLTAIGDRQENFYEEISALVAPVCDYFFIRPPKQKYLRGRKGEEIIRLLSSSIPREKIISDRQSSLPEVISMSKGMLAGPTLFVIFWPFAEAEIDFQEILNEANFHTQNDVWVMPGGDSEF